MKYVALFRGINVGGKNVVKMNELKQLFLELNLYKVQTYIQSGNAVFETNSDETCLKKMIRSGFAERFGFESDILIRRIDEIKTLVERLPFTAEEIFAAKAADPQVEHLYIYFLDHLPEETQIDDIYKGYDGPDILRMGNREAYLLCHQSIRKFKLALHTAKVWNTATVRNWKTVHQLYNLLTSL